MDTQPRMDAWPPRRRARRRSGTVWRYILVGGAALLLLLVTAGVRFYTDWLWFQEVGFPGVYSTSLKTQAVLFGAGFLLFFAIFIANVLLARRLAYAYEQHSAREDDGIWAYVARVGARLGEQALYARMINLGTIALGLVLAAIMGIAAASEWETVLRFLNAVPFGTNDPIFGRDVAFFVFTLPLYRFAQGWLIGTLILVATSALAVYAVVLTYELGVNLERAAFSLTRGIKLHVVGLAASLVLMLGFTHLLDLYEVVYSTRTPAFGAGFADVNYQIPAQYLMFVAALLTVASILATAFSRDFRLMLWGAGIWAVVSVVGGLAIPNLAESVQVKPNQLELERPYLEFAINSTREAYGLTDIQEEFFPADDAVSPQAAAESPATIDNIRLWDHRPLLEALNQIQSIRAYYEFSDVDVDRYVIDGEYRQVMLATRELKTEPAAGTAPSSWVNRRLQFTHGYGFTMAHASEVAEEGRPNLLVRDVPPQGTIEVTRPEIYYGERTSDYVIVRTNEPEFDYPRGDQNATTTYAGRAGVDVGSFPHKLAYALYFRDPNILLSSSLREDSAILYRRGIIERVQQIAPFILLDGDPYLVVADGQLWWMLDGYTTTDRYPYSQPAAPTRGAPPLNYIRNSVKITVNAYDGAVAFYVADGEDALVRTYQRIFPELFQPLDAMPAQLRSHVRYPEYLFGVQASVFQTFHMQDPRVFYNKEDVWDVPSEKVYGQQEPVQPYYVIMRLPGAEREEFLLMQPFTPRGKDNMIAWLAGRSDGAQYGKLLVYKYPKERLIYGPLQVEGRIDQDPAISEQFGFWSRAGASIIRGNMLVIPLGRSNLYVEPIFLQAQDGRIPELRGVVLATGNRVVMEPTLEAALVSLFGTAAAAQPAVEPAAPSEEPVSGAPPGAGVAELARTARAQFDRAQQAVRDGDWARYGEEQRALEETLRRLEEAAAAAP